MRFRTPVTATAILAPAFAHANVSHASGSSLLLLLFVVLGAVLGIPAFAAAMARRGERLASFAVAFGIWFSLIALAIRTPTGAYGHESDVVISQRLGVCGVALVASILVWRVYQWRRKEVPPSKAISGADGV